MNSKLNGFRPALSLRGSVTTAAIASLLVMIFSACTDYQAEFDEAFGALEYADGSGDQVPGSSDAQTPESSDGNGSSSGKTSKSSSSMEQSSATSSSTPASSGAEPQSSEAVPPQSSEKLSSSSAESSSSAKSSSSIVVAPAKQCRSRYGEDECEYGSLVIDGKTYKTVKIGTQWWMAENANYETNDGSFCYKDDQKNCNAYGRLYTWDAANEVCPEGWRLPSIADFDTLIAAIVGGDIAKKSASCTMLKSTEDWPPTYGGSDIFGFNALPAGIKNGETYQWNVSGGSLYEAVFWSSTAKKNEESEIYVLELSGIDGYARTEFSRDKNTYAHSVRCIKEPNSLSSSSVASSSSVSSSSQSSSSEKTEKCYGKEYTPSTHFCDDRDGSIYRYFTTEFVTWMAENLKYETQESYCPEDETEKCEKYGRLYTWEAAKVACPSGWHLASSNEYGQLRYDVGNVANRLMSESWNGQDGIGFDALPAGYRYSSGSGYNYVGSRAYFWTSTSETDASASYVKIEYSTTNGGYVFNSVPQGDRKEAYSVRCAKLN